MEGRRLRRGWRGGGEGESGGEEAKERGEERIEIYKKSCTRSDSNP